MSITDVMTQRMSLLQSTPPRSIRILSASGLGVFDAAQARVMGKMDADKDGALSATELATSAPGGRALGAVDPAFFAALDKDADGKLQLAELRASSIFDMNSLNILLSAQETQGAPEAEPKARFEASNLGAWMVGEADQDGDGLLNADEFAAYAPTGEYAPQPDREPFPGSDILSKAGRAFFETDTDQDGKLSGEELAHLMETGPHRFTMGDTTNLAPTLMEVADSDGDAGLSVDEAKAAVRTSDGLTELFGQGDTDGDGKLSTAEMKAMVDARPTFFANGISALGDAPSAGEMALRRLLMSSLDRLSERFRAQLQPEPVDIRA